MRNLLLVCFLVITAALYAEPRPSYICYEVPENSIKIDGRLDEFDWAQTPVITLVHMKTGEKIPYPAKVRLLWDEKYLYAAYDVAYVDAFGYATERDTQFFRGPEMFVKLFLDPDADGNDVFEIHVNPNNCVFDVRHDVPNCNQNDLATADFSWNCEGLKSAVVVHGTLNDDTDADEGMTVELAVPWAGMRGYVVGPPQCGDRWAVSPQCRYFVQGAKDRKSGAKPEYAGWPAFGIVDSHVYDKYAFLKFSKEPPTTLRWKLVWVWSMPGGTPAQIDDTVAKARALGFNAVAWQVGAEPERWKAFIHACRKHGLESYAPIAVSNEKEISYKQELLPGEEKLPSGPKDDPAHQQGGEPLGGATGKEIMSATLPDFRHPFVAENFREKIRMAINQGHTGIALDFIGFRNYHACACLLCKRLLERSAPPGMPPQRAADRFHEETLVIFYEELCAYARAYAASLSRKVKITCHVYPAYLPNVLYGNKLPVDYCGQTVSWFFRPHWNFEKIERYTRFVVDYEAQYHETSVGAPFIGFYGKDIDAVHVKSAERVRKEIQTVKACGARAVQFAELGNLLAIPAVAKAVAEELRGTPEP